MRILEWLIVLSTLVCTLGYLFGARLKRPAVIVLLSLPIVFLAAHALLEGLRSFMIPAYASAILAVLLLIGSRSPAGTKKKRFAGRKRGARIGMYAFLAAILLLNSASLYLIHLLPVFKLPEPTGTYGIGTVQINLIDESREETFGGEPQSKREVPINIWYPADKDALQGKQHERYPREVADAVSLVFGLPSWLMGHVSLVPTHIVEGVAVSGAQSSYPVVLFSPGVRSTRFQSMAIIEEMVSNGYIVVGMDHPYSSARVKLHDGSEVIYAPESEEWTSSEIYAHNVIGVGVRAQDAIFVLDSLTAWNTNDPRGLLTGKLDLSKVGIFGHSYGGATTAEALALDERFKAGLSLEGGFWGTVSSTSLKQPFMYIMTGNTIRSLDPSSGATEKVVYDEFDSDMRYVMNHALNDTFYLEVEGFYHQSFTDIALFSPPLFSKDMDPVHTVDLSRAYTRAFFDQYLLDKEQELLKGPAAAYPEVHFQKERWMD
ncbi:lipase [Paenibacillus oryzae]|uniref:Lipase n=1 Tax=Paenibacillus oryzae TaxID=1844972 RepID=A0A1A5YE92_9BACL|nr:lipase [Paenibacillus oryzae]OBR63720.1 lipase [Paenibacillus oryzae]